MADKKFSPMRYTASSEEAAVQGALAVVGVSRDDIEYEVLDQSAKGITVRIKPRSTQAPVAAPIAAVPVAAAPAEDSPIVEDVPELLAQDDEIGADSEAEEIVLETQSPEVSAEVSAETGTTSAVENFLAGDEETGDETENIEPVAQAEAEAKAEAKAEIEAEPALPLDPALVTQAQAKAQEFLDKMGLVATAHLGDSREPNTAALIIDGADVGILIGKHGATLQSFQYLLNLTLNCHLEGDGMRVVVDAGNYRARRQSSLEQIARGAAAKARRDARSVRLDPMPAHERRLVHMFLQTETDIYTQSEGREPLRRIVISPSQGPQNAGAQNATSQNATSQNVAPRESSERPYGGDHRGQHSGMGGFARRNNEGSNGGNRGFNRGR